MKTATVFAIRRTALKKSELISHARLICILEIMCIAHQFSLELTKIFQHMWHVISAQEVNKSAHERART